MDSRAVMIPEINLTHLAKSAFQDNGGLESVMRDSGEMFKRNIVQVRYQSSMFLFNK